MNKSQKTITSNQIEELYLKILTKHPDFESPQGEYSKKNLAIFYKS